MLQVKNLRLDHRPRGFEFNKWARKLFEVPDVELETPEYSEDEMWIYYTIHSLVGVQIHFSHSGHVTNLDRIRSGKYYSAATVDSMESHYLARIAELKSLLSLRDRQYLDATTKIVIKKVGQKRISCRFAREDKIHNKTGKRDVQ